MGRYRDGCELRGPEEPFKACGRIRLPWCALRTVNPSEAGLSCTDFSLEYLDELDNPTVPLNAVTYQGQYVTYEGQIVTYGG